MVELEGEQPAAARKGRPITIAAGEYVLESALGGDEVPALRGWLQDPLFASPLGRRAGDAGDEAIRRYVARFDRLLSHLLVVRDAQRRPLGIAIVQIDGRNRVAWYEVMVGPALDRDTQFVLSAAARALAGWGFDELELAKISVQVAETNARTAAWLAERMTLEARLRDEIQLADGTRGTILRYAILRGEWRALQEWYQRRDRDGVPPVLPKRSFAERSGD